MARPNAHPCAVPVEVILLAGSTTPDRPIGEGPHLNRLPGPLGWGLGVRLTTSIYRKEYLTPTRNLQSFGYQGPSKPSKARMTGGNESQQEAVVVRLGPLSSTTRR